jgi:anhydro-N-acetylmuramic acid kinase
MAPPMIVVGLMSGTSLDGISAAAVRFHEEPDGLLRPELLHFLQRSYDDATRTRLAAATLHATAREYCRLHAELGEWLADAACAVMEGAGLSPRDVRAVASHGQTLWHEPGHSTWQLGDASRIAERTQCAVVSDFRVRDMAAGGQGAPLVAVADSLLFSHATAWRALQNIGGIGNMTVVPPGGGGGNPELVRAFDTGPGVVIMDGVMQRLYGAPFDRDGAVARQGRVVDEVIREGLRLPFLDMAPPKSTGRELFSTAFIDRFMVRCLDVGASSADVVATATAFTAATIADQYVRHVTTPVEDVLVSGGGARNPVLLQCLGDALRERCDEVGRSRPSLRRFDDVFFDAEAKEAVAFALLGYLHLAGRAGNVPSATGARESRTLGAFTPAR